MQVDFATFISEKLLVTKCFTFSEIIHEFVSNMQCYQILSQPQRMVIS